MTSLDFQTRRFLKQQVAERQRAKLFAYEVEVCGGACAQCGTPWSMPTVGCKACGDRERRRAVRANRPFAGVTGRCAGCGTCVKSKYTVGCDVCWYRRRDRAKKAA